MIKGRLGADMTLEEEVKLRPGKRAWPSWQRCEAILGSLDRVIRVVKLLGLVRCTDDFEQQPAVINGCSQLFSDILGAEMGIGTRSALGTNALPTAIATEIEGIFEIQ